MASSSRSRTRRSPSPATRATCVTVAAGCSIEFLAPSAEGDELVAVAQERSLEGRNGVYDVDVMRADGGVVATFRGRSAATRATVLGDAAR